MDINRLCMGCMQEMKEDYSYCPKCGHKTDALNSSRGLQPQTILNGKYLVGKVIGEGGFGITYIAYDLVLNNRVAIKEYFPSELVTRDTSSGVHTSLTVLTGSKEEQYKKGIERFIREAGNLARFNNLTGIVSVKEFFYENNTAYMVMEYIDGVTLSKYLNDNGGKLPYTKVLEMMSPVMESLEKVHEAGIVHRDISPDNIMVTQDGRVKLIDFGAARIVGNSDVKSLTVILKHGYAPEEQYQPDGKQGPWTDVYALAATMYRMITGEVPQESTDRVLNADKVEAVNKKVSDVPRKVSDAIMHGLAVRISNRPQRISDFREELEKGKSRKRPLIIGGFAGAAVIVALIIGIVFSMISKREAANGEADSSIANVAGMTSHGDKDDELEEKPGAVEVDTEKDSLDEEKEPERVLTEEEEMAQWKSFQDAIINMIDKSLDDGQLHGIYDDFDGDGDKELFMALYPLQMPTILYSDENGVWIEEDYWGRGGFVRATQDLDVIISLRDYIEESRQYDSDIWDFTMNVMSFGRQKLCYYDYYLGGNHYCCYSVWDQEPRLYQEILTNEEGLDFVQRICDVKCFTSMGEELYTGDFFAYYAPYYLNGEFGELASCQLTEDQYTSIEGLMDWINGSVEYIRAYFYTNGYVDGSGWPFDRYIINNIDVDSVFYNEEGYFVVNYKCYCSFTEFQIDSRIDGSVQPYYISLVENYSGDVNYTGSEENLNVDTVAGLYAHEILKYDGETYTTVSISNGYIGSSVTENVLVVSECPWVD